MQSNLVERTARAVPVREYVGKAWLNVIDKEGELKGRKFINVKFDRGVTQLKITDNVRLELWPNNSMREGKKDADFNVRVIQFAPKAITQPALPIGA